MAVEPALQLVSFAVVPYWTRSARELSATTLARVNVGGGRMGHSAGWNRGRALAALTIAVLGKGYDR